MGLKALGLQPLDRVAMLMPEIPEAYYLIEAFQRLGIVYTSLPTSLGDQQVSDRVENLGVTCLVYGQRRLAQGKARLLQRDPH